MDSQALSARAFRLRVALLVGLAVGIGLGVLFVPPVAQDPAYHAFADRRGWLGIPNFGDVASNLPFVPFGLWGLWALRKARFHDPRERWAYLVAFALALAADQPFGPVLALTLVVAGVLSGGLHRCRGGH